MKPFKQPQHNWVQAEIRKGLTSLPDDYQQVNKQRLLEEFPDLYPEESDIQPHTRNKQSLVLFSNMVGSVILRGALYNFLRRPGDFDQTIEAHVACCGEVSSQTLSLQDDESVAYDLGTTRITMPLKAGYWVPKSVVGQLDTQPGSGFTSPLRHYLRVALYSSNKKVDYDSVATLARKLTNANIKPDHEPSWL